MAKEPTKTKMTAEEAAEMRAQLAQFEADQREEATAAIRDKAAPLIGLVQLDGFQAVRDAIDALDPLTIDPDFRDIRVHADAARLGLIGLAQAAAPFVQSSEAVPGAALDQ